MDSQTGLVDHQRPPRAGHQLSFAYDPRRLLDQCCENIESSAAYLERDAVFLENPLSWPQPKRSKLYYTTQRRLSGGRIGMEFALRLRIRGRSMRFWLSWHMKLHARAKIR